MKKLLIAAIAVLAMTSIAEAQTMIVCRSPGGVDVVFSGPNCPGAYYFIRYLH